MHSIDNPLPTDSLSTSSEIEELFKDQSNSENAEEIGSFIITFYPDYAPLSCENIESLIKEGYYDGLTFHRVWEGFMAQTGDPTGTGMGGSEKEITGEFAANGWNKNTLSHTRGVVSLARKSNDYNSANSQFFIVLSDDYVDTLDGNYAAFGKVTEGMEVVDKFVTVEMTDGGDRVPTKPTVPITIEKAEMIDDDAEGHHRAEFKMTIG
ncbi:MAG: peptidylprolyl isomerase [Ruminococcus sp.]|nr:peptidylprolyl isomerase [Ruminococcus sp.]